MSLAASADDSSCGHCAGVRAGSSSSAHSSNTACSDGSHCSSGAATVATEDCSAADAAADLLCRTYSSCSACSNKSHHVESRPAPGGDLALGSSLSSWILRDFGGKEVLAEFEFGQTLGCGTFGVTRLVTHRKTASMWACKSICKASIAASPAAQSDVQHEVQILQHLRGHNGIVQLKGAYEDERNIHLVMELCTGGDLLDYISRFQRLQEDEAADVASVMLSTLAHCHRCAWCGDGAVA
jgi:calcium-dependent protein kinase